MQLADSRKDIPASLSLTLAIIAIIILVYPVAAGMQWGLPSEVRNELTFGFNRELWRAPSISQEEAERPWEAFPNMLPGGPERTGSASRSGFNPIRSYHPDEYVFLKSLSAMEPSRLKLFPGFFGWPALHFYVIGAGLKIASWFEAVELVPDMNFYFQNPEAMARLYIVGRVLTLLFAAGCIIATWAAVRRLMGNAAAAAAALLLAVTPIFTINSHYMTADVPMLFWLSLVLYFSAGIVNGAGRREYIFAGIALGLAAATRYQGALGAFMIAAAHLLRPEADKERWSRFIKDKGIWIAAGASLLVFLACNPYIFAYPGQFWRELTSEAAGGSGERSRFALDMLLKLALGLGIIFSVASAASFCMSIFRRDRMSVFILLGLGLPALLLALGRPTMARYMMPALLFPIALTAWAFMHLYRRGLEIGRKRQYAPAALLAVLVAVTFAQSFAFAQLYFDDEVDIRTYAGVLIAKIIPGGAKIGVISDPWQFELPPMNPSWHHLVIGDPNLGPDGLVAKSPDYIVASDLQSPPLAARTPGEGESEFWQALWNGEGPFSTPKIVENWPFGLKELSRHGPQDLRYANPVIVISRVRAGEKRP